MKKINRWSCTNNFYIRFLTGAIFLLAPVANMYGTSRLFIGCMKWQHAVVMESIWETDSIKNFLTTKRTGCLTPLLTSFTSLFFSLLPGQIIQNPIHLPLLFGQKNPQSKFSLHFALPWQKNAKSNFKSAKLLWDNFILCLNRKSFPILQKNSKSHFASDLEKLPLLLTHSILLLLESKQCPLTLALVLACADSVDQLRFWNKSEVHFAQLFTHSIPLPLESKQCPLILALVLACADSVDQLQFWNKSEFWFAQTFTHYIPLPLESKQCPLTLASVLACADSADELRF